MPPKNDQTRRWTRMGCLLRRGFLALLLATALPAAAVAAEVQLPPITEPATHERHLGKVVFRQLVTPDLAAAKRFYSGLFGWTFRDFKGGGRYAEALLNNHPVAGLVEKPLPAGERRRPSWLTFISVKDVEAANRIALQNGAKALLEPRVLPGRGKEAVLADPDGAVFAILSASSGDPSDVLNTDGEWIWSSLSVKDPDKETAFYQKLCDYEVFELPSDAPDVQHLLLSTESFARASVNSLPPESKARPHWLNYVRVKDAAQMAKRAVALGGTVLVEPRPDRHGGKLAIVADPQGAAVGLMEWPAEKK